MIERKMKNEKKKQIRELQKKLQDPAVPPEEKDRLVEELYRDMEILYVEPEDYFPKAIREKHKLGEYAEPEEEPKEEYLEWCGGIKPFSVLPTNLDDEKMEGKE